jgi:hypothetical protein
MGNRDMGKERELIQHNRSGEGGNCVEQGKDMKENRMWRERKLKLLSNGE